ncbi:hypothetical protein RUM44_013552 [Polyplax serrata]|uniref:Golgi-associated PDZ and coiled-coil motif-containing protein n=1 Tax=Polyplax serrata TaxID=468196 RepID=A0ABR1BI41_POLSC
MAVTIVSFRWLEILEKEFDKNFVDLDLLIGDLDGEEPDFVHSARQKLAGLSSCFAQLTHKAQTIFQNSAKVEVNVFSYISIVFCINVRCSFIKQTIWRAQMNRSIIICTF